MKELAVIPNSRDRLFEAFASVEVKDSQGDLIPIDELRRVMPVYMKRGGALQFQHSNKPVGRVVNYEFTTKNTPAGDKPALKITGMLFDDYPDDDAVWNGIKTGKLTGISFGGNGKKLGNYKLGDDEAVLLSDLQPFEFSIVDHPANPEATFEGVSVAKSEAVMKPFAGYASFNACVADNQDKDNPEAYCGAIQSAVEKIETREVDKMKKEEEEKPREDEEKKPEEEEKQDEEAPAASEPEEEAPSLDNRVAALEQKLSELLEYMSAAQPTTAAKEDGEGEEEKLPLPDDQKTEKPSEGEAGTPETDEVNFEEKVAKAVRTELKKALAGFKIANAPRAKVEVKKKDTSIVPNPVDIAMGKANFGVEELVKFDQTRSELESR